MQKITSGSISAEEVTRATTEINSIDGRLTPLEDQFSYTLSEGARWISSVLGVVVSAWTALLVILGTWFSSLYYGEYANPTKDIAIFSVPRMMRFWLLTQRTERSSRLTAKRRSTWAFRLATDREASIPGFALLPKVIPTASFSAKLWRREPTLAMHSTWWPRTAATCQWKSAPAARNGKAS